MTCPAQQIEDAVVELILASNIPGLDEDGVNVVRREMPEKLDKDPPVLCIVCVGNDRMPSLATHEIKTNTTNIYEYPVLVVVAKKSALVYPKADPWKKEIRFTLKNLLYRSLLLGKDGVVRRCVYIPEPEINTVGFQRDMKVSSQMFLYRTEEIRTA